jgi:hypothetical protein
MVHNPVATNVTVPPLVTVQVLAVLLVYVNGRPDVVLPLTVNAGSMMLLSLRTVKVIVCNRREVNECVTLVAAA